MAGTALTKLTPIISPNEFSIAHAIFSMTFIWPNLFRLADCVVRIYCSDLNNDEVCQCETCRIPRSHHRRSLLGYVLDV